MRKAPKQNSESRVREDGRRQVLLYMKPELIRALKRAALDEDVPAYQLAEDAIAEFLKNHRMK
jgi:hypothetical protein